MLFEGKPLAERSVPIPVWRRLLAWLVDAALSVLITAAVVRWCMQLAAPKGKVAHLADFPSVWIAPVFIAGWVIYRAATEASGASVGKWIFRVRAYRPQGKLGFWRAFVRALTAPLDTVFGHLEREGPVDQRLAVKLEPERRGPRRTLRLRYVVCIALAMASAASLFSTTTGELVKELHWLEATGKCGQVPREVLRFTDRSERGHSDFLNRCDQVITDLVSRAERGDARASAAVGALPYARDWGYVGSRRMTAASEKP